MSNEELVLEIQGGREELLGELWEQVAGFVHRMAYNYLLVFEGRGGVELDDLCNCGYLAMYAAVQTYSQVKGMSFVGWLAFYLKQGFAEACGLRSRRHDPLHDARSLDAPLENEEGEGDCFGALVEDQSCQDPFLSVEDQLFRDQLRTTLELVLSVLPEEQQKLLRMRYYGGKTLLEISQEMGLSLSGAEKREKGALKTLRRSSVCRHSLEPFMSFDFFHGSGLKAFQRTGCSIQELYLEQKERSARR